jgi:hypothetical protein
VFNRKELIPFENCKIVFVDEIFEIEKPGTQLNIFCLAPNEVAPTMRKISFLSTLEFQLHDELYCIFVLEL